MKPRRFFVSVNEIQQSFAFADRFKDSYARTVTLSNGSVRTIKLTPVVRDGQELVELNDSGHVTYMGPDGTTTNGKLMIQLSSLELAYPDEKSCAVALLAEPVVWALYERLATDPESIQVRLDNLPPLGDNPQVDYILKPGSAWHGHSPGLPLELSLLIGLMVHGSPELRQALAPKEGQPGDIPFMVMRKQGEAELESTWPAADQQMGRIVLQDDPFVSMRMAADILESAFSLDPQSAHDKMREIHEKGSCVLEWAPGSDVAGTCRQLNAGWRARGLSLYCLPQG